jgi:hypothetical protein
MNIIYNEEEKILICALARCGTNFLADIAPHINYKVLDDYHQIKNFSEYTIVKIVREPMNRFVSWWYSFKANLSKTEDHPRDWTEEETNNWIEKFKDEMHYDEHTGLQSILYFQNPDLNHNNLFIKLEDIDIFLGFSVEKYRLNRYVEDMYNNIPIMNRLIKTVKRFYKRDLEWYNNLDTRIPGNFRLKFFSVLTKLDMGVIDRTHPMTIDLGTIKNDLEIDVDFGKF